MFRADKAMARAGRRSARQGGLVAVEFGIVLFVFLSLLFGVLEITRAMYLFNTLQEVTRRAAAMAANSDFSNETVMQTVRQTAIFRNAPGLLALGDPVTDAHVQIEYLSVERSGTSLGMVDIPQGSLPSGPARNRVNCATDLNSNNCIRLVRVQICMPGNVGTCDKVPYKLMFPLIELPLTLPPSTTVRVAETLGFVDGMVPGA